jgi:hypothetical protein
MAMRGLFRGGKFLCALSVVCGLATISQPQFSAAAEESVPAAIKSAPATHKQKKIVTVASPAAGEKLEDFCTDAKGRIVALIGAADAAERGFPVPGDEADKPKPKFDCEVRIYLADGKLAEKWPVGFSGQAINTAPDGTLVIGGDGHVARFDAHGKKLHEAESPQMTYISKNPDEMRERAKEQLESDRAMYADQVKQFEDQLKELRAAKKEEVKKEAKSKKRAADDEEQAVELNEQQLAQYVQIYKQQLQSLEKRTIEQVLEAVLARARRTHSITASEKDVYVSCPAMAGYGFGVWRTDEKFGQAKEIIKSLSGCCGQMDVQCCNDELYVCENSRHRVVRFDRDGKEIGQFGKRDRTGEGENFGGCCNPMNLCFNKQGNLYVSESNGVVKHFTPAGEYLGIVGIAEVQPGCKNSCVGVTADDSRLYYIDVYKSQIVVLTRGEETEGTAESEAE